MPAPIGNKNAEKYTLGFVQDELRNLLKKLIEDETIVYIGELFLDTDYPREYFSRWHEKYEDDEVVCHTIKKILNILETRVAKGAIYDQFNASFTKFHLINNFHWKDKTEQEITLPDNKLTIEVVHNS